MEVRCCIGKEIIDEIKFFSSKFFHLKIIIIIIFIYL